MHIATKLQAGAHQTVLQQLTSHLYTAVVSVAALLQQPLLQESSNKRATSLPCVLVLLTVPSHHRELTSRLYTAATSVAALLQ
jgi:predicted amidophosphoribosyltransferase